MIFSKVAIDFNGKNSINARMEQVPDWSLPQNRFDIFFWSLHLRWKTFFVLTLMGMEKNIVL